VVYEYCCPKEECQPSTSYVGYTECTLSERIRNHTQNGSIQQHSRENHNIKLTSQDILNSTNILRKFQTKIELTIAEALYIKLINPTINAQREGETRILSIF